MSIACVIVSWQNGLCVMANSICYVYRQLCVCWQNGLCVMANSIYYVHRQHSSVLIQELRIHNPTVGYYFALKSCSLALRFKKFCLCYCSVLCYWPYFHQIVPNTIFTKASRFYCVEILIFFIFLAISYGRAWQLLSACLSIRLS